MHQMLGGIDAAFEWFTCRLMGAFWLGFFCAGFADVLAVFGLCSKCTGLYRRGDPSVQSVARRSSDGA